jgi:hypothetical protein
MTPTSNGIDSLPRRSALAPWFRQVAVLTILVHAAGCFGSGEETVDAELSGQDPVATAPVAPVPAPSGKPAAPVPTAQALPALELNLKVGDRFPLRKVVEQELTQPSADNTLATSRSRLELLLSLEVEEFKDPTKLPANDPRSGFKRFSVRYHRVRFERQLSDHTVRYDSAQPPSRIPAEALGYHGLVNNTFQFWMDADNQIKEMVGFDAFLDRCLDHVPEDRKSQVRTLLAANSGADGIANFVDDSLGILPKNAVREGDQWTRSRNVIQPVPMRVETRYTLRSVAPAVADIEIVGSVFPSVTFRPAETADRDLSLNILGGQVFGTCQVDRRTGLPIESRLQQEMRMRVTIAGGIEFDQRKITTTTVNLFQSQSAPSSTPAPERTARLPDSGGDAPATGSAIQPAAAEAAADDRPAPLPATSDIAPAQGRSVVR